MRIPAATYRLQFNPAFDFSRASEILQYLHILGITDIYASPVFKAKQGSQHGYDVVDVNCISPELGGEVEMDKYISALHALGMGLILDIVPNHMAFDGENAMLMDVLENGHNSEYYDFFDIEWSHVYDSLSDRLLAPFLGQHYSEALNDREICLGYGENGFFIKYYDLCLPLKIESYVNVIAHGLGSFREKIGDDHPDLIKFLGILYSIKSLSVEQDERLGRYSQIKFIKKIMWELYGSNNTVREFIDANIAEFNGGDAGKGDMKLLDDLLSEQLFRLAFWKVATEELNYRRFFNINGLISLSMEKKKVFSLTHSLIFSLIKAHKIDGLRIDHIDGLYDPTVYLRRLREKAVDSYIVVEKILEPNEQLPSLWAVQGTTGYDYLNYANGVFCDVRNGRKFNRLYYGYTGFKTAYDVLLYQKKKIVIEKDMGGDVDNLAHLLKKIAGKSRYGTDMTMYGLRRATVKILANFPVYRTYINADSFSEQDREYIYEALTRARNMNPGLLYELDFIERYLCLDTEEGMSEEDRLGVLNFVMRFQQMTGPLMAKGFEDTTLYVYNRLLSLNDVGGSPDRFGIALNEFHDFNSNRSRNQPHSMNATATHDTKRGEDIRARLNVLSEIPAQWEGVLKKWTRMNRNKKKPGRGVTVPDRNDEYFLYQTLIGAMPFNGPAEDDFMERLKAYIIKAVREAKVHTAWLKPDSEYEESFISFIYDILEPVGDNEFYQEFCTFHKMIAHYGIINSLSQVMLKMTLPGVPDFYQGTEFWDFSMVDPDNRRAVDFKKRAGVLEYIIEQIKQDNSALIEELLATASDGRIKMYLIYRILQVRNKCSHLFEKGEYLPLKTSGKFANNIVAFAREQKPLWVVTVIPRFITGVVSSDAYPLGGAWEDTLVHLPDEAPENWQEEITGLEVRGSRSFAVSEVLQAFPCALLVNSA